MLVVVDSHNAGLYPLKGRYKILNCVSRFIQRYADLTLVTNEFLKQNVENNGGRAFVLQNKIPELKRSKIKGLRGKYNILFICTYDDDEPYEIVFKAAKVIAKNIFIYVTGSFDIKGINTNDLPENVVFTDYIPEEEYISMFHSIDATIDLTNGENCLVCGAYESIAAGKLMVLLKTRALMEYFNNGSIYVEHNTESIVYGIRKVIKRKEELSKQVSDLRKIRVAEWQNQMNKLETILIESL